MKKMLCGVFIFLVLLSSAARAELKTETVEYSSGGTVMEGYLVYDDAVKGPRPGVLVVHEWMGLNDYAKKRADMLAALGYSALAVDVYGKGVRPQTVEGASAEASKYKNDRGLLKTRMVAGLQTLRASSEVDPARVAAIGYCFGGTSVLELARSGADVKGVVSFHGSLNTPTPEDAKNIKARVLVLHGEVDPFVLPREVLLFEKEMKDANVAYKVIQYLGAVHGFTNPSNKGEIPGALYDAAADAQSWEEMKEFLKTVL